MFWAYLWGIETLTASSKYRIFHISFEPTYEELKLTMAVREAFSPESFEPTYEELKLKILMQIVTLVTRFEPTYEELKL